MYNSSLAEGEKRRKRSIEGRKQGRGVKKSRDEERRSNIFRSKEKKESTLHAVNPLYLECIHHALFGLSVRKSCC